MSKLDRIAEAGWIAYGEAEPSAPSWENATEAAKQYARGVALAIMEASGPTTDAEIAEMKAEFAASQQ